MITEEDESTSGLNERLRPRKSTPSPQSNEIARKPENKNNQDKIIRNKTLSKDSRYKIDNAIKNSDGVNPQLLCPYCDKTFISKETASKHAHRIHLSSSKQDSFIDCLFCNHVESESNNIIRHMVDSHPNQYFACLDCQTRFLSTSELAVHKLNVCEKHKLPYRSKLRQRSLEGKKAKSLSELDTKEIFHCEKDFSGGFNGIVISCELKPSRILDEADVENNIKTNLILPSGEGMGHNTILDKNAVIVLDDIQWKKRVASNFSFHNTDTDQILSRLGVVHRALKTDESTKNDWPKTKREIGEKFKKCFDTNFYSKVASNVQVNLSKYLDGSLNSNAYANSVVKPKTFETSVTINTAEGFPTLLAYEQFSRTYPDGSLPRDVSPKNKWKRDSCDDNKDFIICDKIRRDSHRKNCIITNFSHLDIWTQLCMRRKYEIQFNREPSENRTEKQSLISKELKEILESRQIPTSQQNVIYSDKPTNAEMPDFPKLFGLTPTIQQNDLQLAVLSGELARPRCYVCCACGEQTRDFRNLSLHISSQHPNAQVEHYEIVGEELLRADILKHLYVPSSQTNSRTRPLRGIRECTKCKRTVSLEDLHQHMLECAGDTPTVRRKSRHRPFGVRKRRPRLPDNRIRKKMRKDIRTQHTNDRNHMRRKTKAKTTVGDAETIRKMIADLPAKRHRIKTNPLNSFCLIKSDQKRNDLLMKRHNNLKVGLRDHPVSVATNSFEDVSYNEDDDDDDDDLPLRPAKVILKKNCSQKECLNERVTNCFKRKPVNETCVTIKITDNVSECTESNDPEQLSSSNNPNRVNINSDSYRVRQHSDRGGSSNNRDDQRPGCSEQNGSSQNSLTPTQNAPLKHSIARLTADSETHDKAVQFHRLFLVQQECNNVDQSHLPSDRRVLFENEAVENKLDKPPLHFNHGSVFDKQHCRKNRLSKQRKGLNDCIAMLKNKLVPNNDVPRHVSVQCGSDEPIDQEPFNIEQRFNANPGVNSDGIPAMQQQVKISSKIQKELETTVKDNVKSSQSDSNATSTEDQMSIDLHGHKQDLECVSKEIIKNQNIYDEAKLNLNRQNCLLLDIETSQTHLVPPRNTVIRKSPKISVNYSMQHEEINPKLSAQLIDSNDNKKGNTIDNNNVLSNDVIQPQENNEIKELNIRQMRAFHINASDESENRCFASNDAVKENVDKSCKINSENFVAEFYDFSPKIPVAHANIETILSTPLDLSMKKRPNNSPERNLQSISFVSNSYVNNETLDLSNKYTCRDQSFTENLNIIDKDSLNVVVDLSTRQISRPTAPSIRSNLLRDQSLLIDKYANNNRSIDKNFVISEYDSMNVNLPTDLTLKNVSRSISADLTPQSSGMFDVIQDLSNRNIKQLETQEHNKKMDYCNKDLPRDLSKNGIKDNLATTDNVSRGYQITSDCQEMKRKVNQLDMGHYENPVNKLPKEVTDFASRNSLQKSNHHLEENVFDYSLQSTNIKNNSLKIQHNLSQMQTDIHDDPKDKSIELNKENENKGLMKNDIVPQVFQRSVNEIDGYSSPIDENLTVIMPQDNLSFKTEKSPLTTSVPSESDYLSRYSSMKYKLIPQLTRDIHEVSTPIHILENVAVTVTKVNSFYSSLSTYTQARNTVGTLDFNETGPNSTCTVDKDCLRTPVLPDTRSNSVASDVLNDHCNLTKEETVDCDIESDTETARKIAMLPKELVEILGTIPIDHRNQLLNVLPQYVSTSATATPAETSSCLRNKSSKSSRTTSPVKQKTLITDNNCVGSKNQSYDFQELLTGANCRQSINIDVASVSTYPVKASETLPQSVILKTPSIVNDAKRDFSVLNHHSYPVPNTIIDLTDDENIKVFHDNMQVVDNNLSNTNQSFGKNSNVEFGLEPLRPKGNSEQTASLRAVRIKTPSQRNKRVSSEFRVQSHDVCDSNVGNIDMNLEEQTSLFRIDDKHEKTYTMEVSNKNITHASHTCVSHLRNIAPVEKSHSCNEKDGQQIITFNKKILIKPAVILRSVSSDKSLHGFQEKTCEKLLNDSLENLPDSIDQDVIMLDDDDTNDFNVYEDSVLPISSNNTNCQAMIEEYRDSPKLSKETSDEDSEDDVTLAVIVQQKHLYQAKLTPCNDNTKLTRIEVTTENKKRKKGKKIKKALLEDVTDDTEILSKGQTPAQKQENIYCQNATLCHNNDPENLPNKVDLNKEKYGTEIENSNYVKKTRNSPDPNYPVVISDNINKEDISVACKTEVNNLSSSTNIVQKYKEPSTNKPMTPDKLDTCSRLNSVIENIIVQTSNNQRRENVFQTNLSKNKVISKGTEIAANDENFTQVSQQSFLSLSDGYILDKEMSYEEGFKNKKCPKDCIAHNYKQYSVSNIIPRNSDEFITKEIVVKPQNIKTTNSVLNQDIRLKKINNKFRKEIIKYHADSPKAKQLLIENEKNTITSLRRSRRGKSMFVDKKLAEPVATNSIPATSIKTPLTKKQLIFSKLLLDGEKLSKTNLDSADTKDSIGVINHVELSPQFFSTVCQVSVDATKDVKNSKRKKSPQLRQKIKKAKQVDHVQCENDDDFDCTTLEQPSINNTDKNICEETFSGITNTMLNSNSCTNDKVSVVQFEQEEPSQAVTHSSLLSENKTNEKKDMILSPNHDSTLDGIISAKKRTRSATITESDAYGAVNQKSKKINKNELEPTRIDERKRNRNVHYSTNSKTSNNNSETKNKTYNSTVPIRRTRSKSVIEKSKPLYDPYDIDLEEMIQEDEPVDRRLQKSDKKNYNLNLVKDKLKRVNKRKESIVLNTEQLIKNNDIVWTRKNNEDTGDSDDSSKSDVPLKKLVEEREKKNLKTNNRSNAGQISSVGENNRTEKIEENIHNNEGGNSSQQVNETNKAEQFMESFGFFSERKPRKSNLIATKKISETFNAMSNESDEVNDEKSAKTSKIQKNKSSLNECNPRDITQSHTKKSVKRGRKKTGSTKPLTTYCSICQKEFRRPDNYLRHQMTLLHIARLSEVEMRVKTTSILDKPNYLVAYKQQLDHLKMLSDKAKRKETALKSSTKLDMPNSEEILANVNNSVRDQQLTRRNLSRDEALFIDCCELLKESHKPDIVNNGDQVTIISNGNEQVTIMSSVTEQVTITSSTAEHTAITASSREQVTITSNNTEQTTTTYSDAKHIPVISDCNTVLSHTEITGADNKNDTDDTILDGEVDSITAKNILESEEVLNLEKDVISAALSQISCKSFENVIIENKSDQKEDNEMSTSSIGDSNCAHVKERENEEFLIAPAESTRNPDVKDKLYPQSIENIDIFEDKFDKIKRKCRSQAAAAKHVQPMVEPCTSHKRRKKSEKKRGKKTAKKSFQFTIPTKGALKGFDGLKVSIPTTDINISGIVPPSEYTTKKKKTNSSHKKKDNIENKNKNYTEHKVRSTQTQNCDVYEFIENEEVDLFELRPSTLMGRFKNLINEGFPSTSKLVPETEKSYLTSESGSDGDDFVYDDYVCSDDETENSILSCELGSGKIGTDTKKNSSPLKRKEIVEKNAVMGKIFKNNAVRTEKKVNKNKEHVKPKANLDQLFDSLLENEPGLSIGHLQKSSIREEQFPSEKHESTKIVTLPQKIYESDLQHKSDSKKNESVKKHDSLSSRKLESSKKHKTSFEEKHESLSSTDYETIFLKKGEYFIPKKHGSKLSTHDCKKAFVSRSCYRDDDTNSSESRDSLHLDIYCKPSTLNEQKYSMIQENVKDSTISDYEPTKSKINDKCHHSPLYKMSSSSSSKIYKSASKRIFTRITKRTTSSKINDEYHHSPLYKVSSKSSPKIYKSASKSIFARITKRTTPCKINDESHDSPLYKMSSNSSPKIYKSASKSIFARITKRNSRDSPNLSNDSFRRYSEGEYIDDTSVSETDEVIDTVSNYANSTMDETSSDEGGVARRRARRKCTVGKQNILAETWSSESEPESGPPRPNSAESMESTVGRKKRRMKRGERQLHSKRRVSRQMPIKRQDVENRVALFKRNTSSVRSVNGNGSRPSSNSEGSHTYGSSLCPSTSAGTSTGVSPLSSSKNQTKTPRSYPVSQGSKPPSRSAGYYWSSEGDDEQDHVPQHGWIVGDSHKKLVTMLAHAKGRNRNHDDKHNVE